MVESKDRQDHGQQNETKYKHWKHNTILKTNSTKTRAISGAPEVKANPDP